MPIYSFFNNLRGLEYNPLARRVQFIALGATELRSRDLTKKAAQK